MWGETICSKGEMSRFTSIIHLANDGLALVRRRALLPPAEDLLPASAILRLTVSTTGVLATLLQHAAITGRGRTSVQSLPSTATR